MNPPNPAHSAAATPKLVVVLGGECSGKTTLCQALASALEVPWVPEYLRQWCEHTGRTPDQAEQRDIAAGQLALTRRALREARSRSAQWVISDGSVLLTAAYSIEYFDDHSLQAVALRQARRVHLSVLLEPDIAWQADGHLRDGPARRASVHRTVERLLRESALPHVRIGGSPAERVRDCLALLR
jgi:nicotinamide riboside kinase